MKYWFFFITIVAAHECYTAIDIKTNVCWALCRQDGADLGYYQPKLGSCICGFKHDFKEYTKSVLKIISEPKETFYKFKD